MSSTNMVDHVILFGNLRIPQNSEPRSLKRLLDLLVDGLDAIFD
jgi:hypothetical protein